MEILSHQLGPGTKYPSYVSVYPSYYGDITRENKIEANSDNQMRQKLIFFYERNNQIFGEDHLRTLQPQVGIIASNKSISRVSRRYHYARSRFMAVIFLPVLLPIRFEATVDT